MKDNKKVRLSIGMAEAHHKLLKICCAELGVSITEFVLKAVDDAIADRNKKRGSNGHG